MTLVPQSRKSGKNSSNASIILQACLHYVCKHSAKFQRSGLKTVGGVDYTKLVPSIYNVGEND